MSLLVAILVHRSLFLLSSYELPPPLQVKSVGQYVKSNKNVKKRQLVMKFARNLLQMRKDDQMQLAVRAPWEPTAGRDKGDSQVTVLDSLLVI